MTGSNLSSLGDEQRHNRPALRIAHLALVGLPDCTEQHSIHQEKGENPVTSLAAIPHCEMSARINPIFENFDNLEIRTDAMGLADLVVQWCSKAHRRQYPLTLIRSA